MDPQMAEMLAKMTPEQAKAFMANLSPEQKMQMQKIHEGMHDLKHIVLSLKPKEDAPDAEVSLLSVVMALASAPTLLKPIEDEDEKAVAEAAMAECTDEVLDKLEAAFVEAKAFDAGALVSCKKLVRRNVLLIYWHMHRSNMKELADSMPGGVEATRGYLNQLIITLLVKAQMALPQQRWVQPTLAVAGASALISNALWSHTDKEALQMMEKILQEDQLKYPKLQLEGQAGPKSTNGEGDECVAGQAVQLTVRLKREHFTKPGAAEQPTPNNPQGIVEAYWLYVEGLKPEGTPNSLIAAQPMVVKDASQTVISAEVPFTAPPNAGEYTLRLRVTSTSVVGVNHVVDVGFKVVEDDVPALE